MATFNWPNGYITDIRGSKYLQIRDIERCPYVPSQPEYKAWDEEDKARIKLIIEARRALHIKANQYLSHPDRNVRNMAVYITGIWGDVE